MIVNYSSKAVRNAISHFRQYNELVTIECETQEQFDSACEELQAECSEHVSAGPGRHEYYGTPANDWRIHVQLSQ